MKLQNLLLTLFAATALFFGCKPEEEPEPALPKLEVAQSELSFEQTGGTATLTVTSNRPWTISTDADWLAFSPANGGASDSPVSVTVTALSNSSTDRTSSFKVKTDFDYRSVNVSQKGQKGEDPNTTPMGKGTADDPYNVAAAIQLTQALVPYNNGEEMSTSNSITAYVKGKVVSVEIDPSYGNATYMISADGTSTTQLKVYRGKYLGGDGFVMTDQLKVGDEVVVYGTLVNFQGKELEFTAGSKIVTLNGSSEAPAIDWNKFELIPVKTFIEKADKAQFYKLKGKVSKFNAQYCSFDLTDDSGTIYVYNVANKDEWVSKISNGGTVELAGLYTYYEKNSQHEVVSAQILSFEGGQGGEVPDAKGTGTLEDPYNPAGAAAAVANLTWTSNTEYQTTDVVYVKGKISKIAEKGTYTEGGTFGNASFFIVEEGTDFEFQVYRALYLGNKKYESGQTDIKVGDEVIICGKLMNYRGNTPETDANNAYLYSLNGVTGGDEPGPGGDTPEAKGTGTLEDPYNPAGAAAAVANLTWTSNTEYQTTDEVYVKGKISKIANKGTYTEGGTFGNASFFIVEEGTDFEFQVYRAMYLGNQKFTEGQTDIKVGDEVIICGKLMNYRGNTPETEANNAYLYSLNGVTGGETPGPGGDDTTDATVAEAVAAENDAVLNVGPALVVATSSNGFLMEQDGAMIYVYKGAASVGDKVTVKATKTEYGDAPQLSDATVTTVSTGNAVTYPEAKDITATFDSYASDTREYVTYKGTLAISGNYVNVNVDGATVIGSILKPLNDISSLDGKPVTITGYYLYNTTTKSGVKYLYVIATKVEGEGGETPGPGPGGDTEEIKTLTVAEFIAAEKSTTQPYKLTGKVSNIANTTYGNFDLTDESGTVYVYGLVSKDLGGYEPNKKNDKSFSSIGIKEGDTITIVAYRDDFTKDGETKIEAAGGYYVSGASGTGGDPGPGGDTPEGAITWSSASSWTGVSDGAETISFTSGNITFTAKKASASTKPTVNGSANDCRVYAKGTLTVTTTGDAMTSIVFNISSQGQKRLTTITANTGTVAKQSKGDKTVTWTGSAKSVTFTVGEKAVYGSDGDSKAGQFDFDSVVVK